MNKRTLLEVVNLGKQLPSHWIWKALNFEIHSGDKLAISGPSGSGKSLLLRALAGLDETQEGQILFRGKPLEKWNMPQYRSKVIYLSQQPGLLEGSVESNLKRVFQFRLHKRKSYNREQILEYLTLFGKTENFLTRAQHQLSGGEKQIVAFLRAFQLDPQILLFDEPTASLDEKAEKHLELFVTRWLSEAPNRAYVWTSHQSSQLKRMTEQRLEIGQYGN
ncbi:ATP-binding cassette domain-containing protein [Deltaproteobacteria bacterium TL4]